MLEKVKSRNYPYTQGLSFLSQGYFKEGKVSPTSIANPIVFGFEGQICKSTIIIQSGFEYIATVNTLLLTLFLLVYFVIVI